MFLRAGFNARCNRTGIMARIYRDGRRWLRTAELIEFLPSRDLAWYGEGRGCSWGHVVRFKNWVHVNWSRTGLPAGGAWRLPSSPIDGGRG